MLRGQKLLHCPKILAKTSVHSLPQFLPISSTLRPTQRSLRFSRRDLSIGTNSLLLLLLGSQAQNQLYPSRAEAQEDLAVIEKYVEQGESLKITEPQEEESPKITGAKEEESPKTTGVQEEEIPKTSFSCTEKRTTKRAFLDISINGEPVGRIVIGLYGDASPAGASRFSDLVRGASGITYRRKEFLKIMPNYVQHGGLRSYGVDAELAKKTGSKLGVENLIEEWEMVHEKCPGTKNLAGTVSIIVRDPSKPPPKLKLVAREGKLEIDQEEVGTAPNGTEFVITTKDSPELDASALVVGRVLEGMEVVEKIEQVKTVQDNTGSPYFRVAKLIGDKRAVVAERGFNRPYAKVIVANCGLMD